MHQDHSSSTPQFQDGPKKESLVGTPATTSATATTPGPGRQSGDDGSSPLKGAGGGDKPSTKLRRSVYVVFLTLLYGAAAVYTWVIVCILTKRPIGGISYGIDQLNHILEHPPDNYLETPAHEYLGQFFAKSERYLRSARIVLAGVSVLMIPLTSAVCSQAAVVYIQRKRAHNRPTLRQTMALADRGWNDAAILTNLVFGGWKKHRSSLLLLAIFLNILGASIFPVQQIFLSFKTIKRTGFPLLLTHVADFTDHFPDSGTIGVQATKLRARLASTDNTEVQPRLWSSSNEPLSMDDVSSHAGLSRSSLQTKSQNTLANMTTITEPFWAELPSGTNTGNLRQFVPRINSTATWEGNSAASLPEDCNSSSDAFYLHYEFDDMIKYSIDVCMPGNMSKPPWKNQMSRQDIREELYFKMDFSGSYDTWMMDDVMVDPGTYSTKLTLDTTWGYFELPNYANGQVPGPLIDEDPFDNSTVGQFVGPRTFTTRDLDNDTAWNTLNATYDVGNVGNMGPLLRLAIALFGEASFVDVQHTVLAAYAKSDIVYGACIDIVPFISLLHDDVVDRVSEAFEPCLTGRPLADDKDPEYNNVMMHGLVAAYFWLFSGGDSTPSSERVENAFASAAFLANDVWMPHVGVGNIIVSYDMGGDVEVPHISRAGIIFISILLGLDLVCLLALSLYSAWIPRWTEKLDSFAMLRIGASMSEKFPLLAARHVGRINALDESPGWIGNASDGEIGELCLGGEQPVRGTQHYHSYSADHVADASARGNPSGTARREGYALVAPGERE